MWKRPRDFWRSMMPIYGAIIVSGILRALLKWTVGW